MKIAVNTRFLLKNKLEGIGKFTRETFKRIVLAHPEHEFIFFFDRPYSEEFIFADNVTPVILFPPARHPILFVWWFEWSVAQALRRYQPDIFISTDGYLTLNTTIKTLLVVHDIAFVHFPQYVSRSGNIHYQYFTPKYVKKAAHIATVSEYSKQDLIQKYQVPNNKISVVYNGCDSAFQPISMIEKAKIQAEFSKGCPYFLYLGSIHPRKNVARLIRAFDQFKSTSNNNFKLLLAGRMAWQIEEVNQALANAKHSSDIIRLDYVPDYALHKIVATAHALTYISLFEGFGIPILEAMYCDVPTITSNLTSMPEVAGNASILVNPYNENDIAIAISKLATDGVFRDDLIEKGKIQRQQFTWDKTASKVWEAIEEVLN
jgi:glycosyltransferase involved in cell wall biosynthesis